MSGGLSTGGEDTSMSWGLSTGGEDVSMRGQGRSAHPGTRNGRMRP
jgi:hypothetical protein